MTLSMLISSSLLPQIIWAYVCLQITILSEYVGLRKNLDKNIDSKYS